MTAEGKVKKAVKEELAVYGEHVYFEMPVPGGFGRSGLDFTVCFFGKFIAIETKATVSDKPTPRQEACIREIAAAGGIVFVIKSVEEARTALRTQLALLAP